MSHQKVRARLCGSVSARTVALAIGTQFALFASAHAGSALPSSGHYVAGSGAIAKKGSSGLSVNQSSATGIIDWSSFSIGKGNKVNFNNGGGATLNRVTGGDLSTIAGSLKATGSVYLINPQGVIVSKTGRVVTGGSFVASTRDENDSDFLDGKRRFRGSSNGDVSNAGKIVSANGDVALIGRSATNSGSLSAANGTASVNAGSQVLLAPAGSGGQILISGGRGDATNSGTLSGAQGQIAAAGGNVYALAGNNGGILRATGTSTIDGHVWLTSGSGDVHVRGAVQASNADGTGGIVTSRAANIVVSGRISASATSAHANGGTVSLIAQDSTKLSGKLFAKGGSQGHGGFVETSGEHVKIADKAKVSTLGEDGLTGDWLIDPNDFTIAASGGDITGEALSAQLATTNVSVASDSGALAGHGDLFVNDDVSWASSHKLTLNAKRDIEINSHITITGSGSIALNSALGGVGDVDFALGGGAITFTNVSSGNNTRLNLNGQFYTLENNLNDLAAAIGTNALGNYALVQDDDESANGAYSHAPISSLVGSVEGLGHTIANLTIEDDGSDVGVGLFSELSGEFSRGDVHDLQVKNISIDATSGAASNVGGLAGRLLDGGAVSNVFVSGTITYGGTGGVIGGVVGKVEGGSTLVDQVSSSVRVGATGDTVSAGGLVGEMFDAKISNAWASGNVAVNGSTTFGGGFIGSNGGVIENSYALGSVSGKGNSQVGGFVGINSGSVSHAYSTGAVSGGSMRGGFAGWNIGNDASIDESYETGKVKTGAGTQGAFVGQNDSAIGATKADFFNSTENSIAGVGNGTAATTLSGLTSDDMMTASSFTTGAKHWSDFRATPGSSGWVIVDMDGGLNNASSSPGAILPMLTSEYSTTISNVHQLQLMELDLDADYVLGADVDASPATAGLFMSAAGFVPIGGNDAGGFFSGSFDGRGHVISRLTFNNLSIADAGLFGVTTSNTLIQNLTLSHVAITQSPRFAGAVAGLNEGTISNVTVSGTMTGGFREAGGIAGEAQTTSVISGSRSSMAINIEHDTNNAQMAGGLVGNNSGAISSSSASGSIMGSYFAGGLVGTSDGTISTSHATGNVSDAYQAAGGFVGQNDGTIDQSYATGAVTDFGVKVRETALGGFVGYNWGSITQSYATGDVSGSTNVSGGFYVGGFAGYVDGDGDIERSYSNGSVSAAGKSARAGGFVGVVAGDVAIDSRTALIKDSYSTGGVSVGIGVIGVNGQIAGGFVGQNEATVEESYSTGAVIVGTNVLSGGFAAIDGGTVQNTYWDTDTSGMSTSAGSAIGLTTAQLQSGLPTGFDNTIWGTDADAYPYLLWRFPSGQQIISGYAYSDFDGSALQGASLSFLANGALVGTSSTGANGYYYVATAPGGSLTGADLFAYLADGSAGALAKANISGASDLILRDGYVSEQLDIDDADFYTNLKNAITAATGGKAQSVVNNLGVAIGMQGGSATSYTLQGDANLGGRDLLVHDTDGSVHLTGTYTAGGLLLDGDSDFVVSMLGENVGAIAADHVHSLSINADSINIGTVDGVRGITSAGDVSLTSSDGPIALTQQVKIGSGTLSFNSQSDITESSAGRIIATSVIGVAAGSVSLNGANAVSQIDEFSALHSFSFANSVALDVEGFSDAAGGAYALTTTGAGSDITINGSISAATGMKLVSSGSILEGLNGQADARVLTGSSADEAMLTGANTFNLGAFTSGGNMTLNSAGALDIVGSVNVGHTLVLNAGSEILEDTSAGSITAAALFGMANGTVALTGVNAIVGVKGFNTSGGDFSLADAADMTVTGVISSGNGNLTLKTTGAGHDLVLKNQIQSDGTVSLISGGRISANANGVISATILTGSSNGAVSLAAENIFARLGNFTTGGGALSITDARFMSTGGKVDTGAGALTLKSETAGRDLTIKGALYTSGTLSLTSGGSITESGAGVIHAGTVTGSANGHVTLANSKNLVANLRAFTTGLDGSLSLSDGQSLTVLGIVDAGAGNIALTTIGSGNIAIKNVLSANGAITLAAAGKIAESGKGAIYAQSLTGSSAGGTTLGGTNFITTLSGFQNAGAGGFSLTNGKALAVAGTLSAAASNAVVALTTTSGDLTFSGKVNSAVVTLVTAGETSQTAKSAIKTKTLNVTAKTGINLIGANHITAIGLRKTKSGPNVIKGIGS